MTTSENVITYDLGMPWYHQSKVPKGLQPTSKLRPFLDLAHGLKHPAERRVGDPVHTEFDVCIVMG